MNKRLLAWALGSALMVAGSPHVARAQFAVIDPANLVQNIVSALQSVQSVLNQVTQISHEVQGLAYQAQNLQNMPASVTSGVMGQYALQFQQLVGAMQNLNGIAQNVATLTAKYNATYPNSALAQGPLSNANVMSQLTGWLNQSRSVYQGAYATQAQVIATLPADTSNVQTLLRTSGSSHGALDAIQTGNQLNGQIAAQLMKMNQQMAATNQAQLNWIAQQTQMIAQGQKMSQDISVGYSSPGTAAVNRIYDRLH